MDARSQQAERVMEQVGNQKAAMLEQLRVEMGHLETSLKESEASRVWELVEHKKQIQTERERMGKEVGVVIRKGGGGGRRGHQERRGGGRCGHQDEVWLEKWRR